jgi:hypothetical protein
MGRSRVGNKLDSYSGLTAVLAANTLQVRNAGTVRAPGRIRALGAYLGANGSPVAKNKLAAYVLDPSTLDPTTKLAESSEFNIDTIWISDGAGGANYEQNIDRPWTPADLPTGWLKFWWRGDFVGGAPLGGSLSQMTDFSGSGNHATQPTVANQALLQANVINGHVAAKFDNVNDYYTVGITNNNLLATTLNQTIMAVIKFSDRPGTQAFISWPSVAHGLGLYVDGNGILGWYNTDTSSLVGTHPNAIADDAIALVSGSLSSSGWSLNINGYGWNGSHSISGFGGTSLRVIGWPDNNSPDGYISEYIITEPTLGSPSYQILEGYMAWANGVVLPPSHPYFLAPPRVHGALVLPGQQIALGVDSSGSLRRPSKFFLGGKRWEQSVSSVVIPDPMVPTVETVDDRDISAYVIIDENRPPVVEMLTPGNFSLVNNVQPTLSVYHSDPDRTEGYGDYIKSLLARVYEKYRGAIVPAGYRSGAYGLYDGPISPITLAWGTFIFKTDLGTRMTTHLLASDIVQSNGTALASWPDTSGNANNAVQATGANQPIFRTNQVNSLPAVDFDGSNDYLSMAGIPGSFTSTPDEAIFMVVKADNVTPVSVIVGTNISGGRVFWIESSLLRIGKDGFGPLLTHPTTLSVGTWYIFHAIIRDKNFRLGVNGNVVNGYNATTFTSATGQSSLGAYPTGGSPFDGEIAHLIRMPASELRPGDEERIIGRLAWIYGLQTSLPGSFTYRNNQPGLRVSPPPSTEQSNSAGAVTFSTNRYEDPALTDGSVVATWVDSRVTSPQNATQATGANQPIYKANVVNGKGAVDFDGVNDYLSVTAMTASVIDEAFFAVINPRSFSTTPILRGANTTGSTIMYFDTNGQLDAGIWGISGFSFGQIVKPNEWSIVHMVIRANDYELGVNGSVQRSTWTPGAVTAGTTTIFGSGGAGTSNQFNGQVAKIVRMPASGLAIDDVDRWVGRLAWEYGIQGKLPDSHMYKFNSPDDIVEHHWTAEIKDEVGGVTGTGYGAIDLDTNTPDGTTAFYPHLNGYFTPTYPLGKITSRTPTPIWGVYTHPLAINIDKIQIQLLKKGLTGEYGLDQLSPWIDISPNQGTGFQATTAWKDTKFNPLDVGFDYRFQMRSLDQNGQVGPWSGDSDFHINYIPDQGVVTSPANRTPVTSPPLSLFSVNDNDDTGVAYFSSIPSLIPEVMWGSFGSGTSQFNQASQVAVDASDNVYVADTGNNRLYKSDLNGAPLTFITLPGVKGVALDASGNIYVTCAAGSDQTYRKYNSALTLQWSQQFTPLNSYKLGFLATDNTYLYMTLDNISGSFPKVYKVLCADGSIPLTWGTLGSGNGQMRSPQGISYFNGEVYVVDSGNRRIEVFNTFGAYQRQISSNNLSTDQFTGAISLAVHPTTGNIWIPSIPRNTIQEISQSGELVHEYGGAGVAAGKFRNPKGITLNNAKTKLYTVESSPTVNNRAQRLRIPTDADLSAKGVAGELLVRGPISVLNQTLDSDIANWSYFERAAFTNTNVTSTLTPYSGTGFVRVTITAGPSVANVINTFAFSSTSMLAVPGFVYRAKFRFRRSKVGVYGQIGINWIDDGGNVISVSWGEVVRPKVGTWIEASVADEAPPGTDHVILEIDAGVENGVTYPFDADFDAVEIEDGVRYLRGGTFIYGDNFSYQLTSTDMPVKGTYSIQARGRDGNSEGPWSDAVVIDYVDGPTATVVSPTSGQVFSTATPLFSWILTAGTQWGYKVEVLNTSGATVYDSGWVQGASIRSHQVPITAGLQDGVSYVGRLWIDNGTLQVLV